MKKSSTKSIKNIAPNTKRSTVDFPISVIVIAYNEEKNIVECMRSILAQDYAGPLELVIIDDHKTTDATAALVRAYQKKHANIKYYVDTKGSQSYSRNLGIKRSTHPYIAFTDADCVVPKDWLTILARKWKEHSTHFDNKLAGVGGANILYMKKSTPFSQAMNIVFGSFFGSLGSIQAKPATRDAPVFSLSCTNVLYDKSKVIEVGMFPAYKEQLGDDWVLGLRLKQGRYTLMGVKDSFVWHNYRSTPKKFWKNMVLYGGVRTFYIKKYFWYNNPKYFLPFGFIIGMILPLFFWIHPLLLLPLLYFPFILLYSIMLVARKKTVGLSGLVFLVFMTMHFGFSIGELKGIRWFFRKI